MREELLEALAEQRASPDIATAADFSFKALEGELTVAGVFVRIFVEQPTFAVADPAAFCKARGLLVAARLFAAVSLNSTAACGALKLDFQQHCRMWCSRAQFPRAGPQADSNPMTSVALPMLSVLHLCRHMCADSNA
jgi:hypothetical protein